MIIEHQIFRGEAGDVCQRCHRPAKGKMVNLISKGVVCYDPTTTDYPMISIACIILEGVRKTAKENNVRIPQSVLVKIGKLIESC